MTNMIIKKIDSLLVVYSGVILFYFINSVNGECSGMISREEWNASDPINKPDPLTENPPPYIVVHHSAMASCMSEEECKEMVKQIQELHMVHNGWNDIGYNFLIGGDGSLFEGRGWGIHGAHVVKYNARSLGICLMGDYSNKDPPYTQVMALKAFLLCAQRENRTIEDYHLIGHRQGSATMCPGDNLFNIIEKWNHFDPNPN